MVRFWTFGQSGRRFLLWESDYENANDNDGVNGNCMGGFFGGDMGGGRKVVMVKLVKEPKYK